jgi:hypothetical protein
MPKKPLMNANPFYWRIKDRDQGPADFYCKHSDLLYVYQEAFGESCKAINFDNEGRGAQTQSFDLLDWPPLSRPSMRSNVRARILMKHSSR